MNTERFVRYKPFSPDVGTVISIHAGFVPDNELDEGIFVTSSDPEVKNYPNLYPILRIKLDTKELFYDYESNDTLEMRVSKVRDEVSVVQNAMGITSEKIETISSDVTDTQVAVTESYETTLKVEEDNTKTQVALTEVYEDLLRTKAALSTVNLAIQTLQTEIAKLKGE